MRSRLLVSTVFVILLLLLVGSLSSEAQMQSLSKRNASWENVGFVAPTPGGDTPVGEGDDEGNDEGDDCPEYAAPLPQTGQTMVYRAGDDGDHRLGVSVEPRFTDNGDATVTDNLTGLIWMRYAQCLWNRQWNSAFVQVNQLADGTCQLRDNSVPGDWRLPNVRELLSLVDFGEDGPAITPGHPFIGVHPSPYWSSTTKASNDSQAWAVILQTGSVIAATKTSNRMIMAVRGPE